NVNDPRIKKWLGEVVGKESEDFTRHDKWLCMMYPRLKLLQKLLSEDGCLVISISFHELNNLVLLLKELFSTRQIVTITVQTSGGKPSKGFNYAQEYLVFVVSQDFKPNSMSFNGGNVRTPFEGLTLATFDKTQRPNQVYPIFINEEKGTFEGVGKSLQQLIDEGLYKDDKANFKYDYSVAPKGCVAVWPVTSKGKYCVWRQISSRLQKDWEKGYIKVSRNKSNSNQNEFSIQYLPAGVIKKISTGELKVIGKEEDCPTLCFGENQTVGSQIPTIWTEKDFYTVKGTELLKEIFPDNPQTFSYPKPLQLVQNVIEAISDKDSIILDSFAGSGTTAHSVLNMNKADGGNRKFILIEMMDYADSITAERIKRVIKGYADKEGTGGDFNFYELGEPLLINNLLNEKVDTQTIRKYIWFTETNTKMVVSTGSTTASENKYFLGKNFGAAYWFYYEKDKTTTLDIDFLSTIKGKYDQYIIYADICLIPQELLQKNNIIFKKIPRDIKKF
ncbi:MAG: site-specific DNA-methyltransferase, partial [Treponemataceae bacterium]|nr:site-specific DNA-methyltransferase [Treponemataceae bacterium]